MNDEIISEVWRNRDALAAKHGHDLDAIVSAIREREAHPLTRMVTPDKPSDAVEVAAEIAASSLWQSR